MFATFEVVLYIQEGFPGGSDGKESACNAGDTGSIPGSGRSPGEGHGNPLQYSCLENSTDTGAWWATAHGVTKSWTRLSNLTIAYTSKRKCYLIYTDWPYARGGRLLGHQVSYVCKNREFQQQQPLSKGVGWAGEQPCSQCGPGLHTVLQFQEGSSQASKENSRKWNDSLPQLLFFLDTKDRYLKYFSIWTKWKSDLWVCLRQSLLTSVFGAEVKQCAGLGSAHGGQFYSPSRFTHHK